MSDPFSSLDPDWARDAERRALRANRVHRLRRGLRPRRPGLHGTGPRGTGFRGTGIKLFLIVLAAAIAVALSFAASALLP